MERRSALGTHTVYKVRGSAAGMVAELVSQHSKVKVHKSGTKSGGFYGFLSLKGLVRYHDGGAAQLLQSHLTKVHHSSQSHKFDDR